MSSKYQNLLLYIKYGLASNYRDQPQKKRHVAQNAIKKTSVLVNCPRNIETNFFISCL